MTARHTILADALADAPEGTIVLGAYGVDHQGFASLWLIFPDEPSRAAYQRRHMWTWIETPVLANFIDYANEWRDRQGYGLHLATYAPQHVGKHLFARRRR
jgi:hypothetical protein